MLDVGRWAYSLHSLQPLRYGVNIWINIIFLGIFRSSARVCWKDDCMACTRVDEGSAKTSRNCIAMHCKYDLHKVFGWKHAHRHGSSMLQICTAPCRKGSAKNCNRHCGSTPFGHNCHKLVLRNCEERYCIPLIQRDGRVCRKALWNRLKKVFRNR